MTSMGEISAARMTIPGEVVVDVPVGDFLKALTTSFTPRFRVLFFAAVNLKTQISSYSFDLRFYSERGRTREATNLS